VIPFLVIQVGRSIWTIGKPAPMLREHYVVLLGWILLSAPLWIAGAIAEPDERLLWWGPPPRST